MPVVGYDDVREKLPIPFPLPSVGSDKKSMAETSVEFLLDRLPSNRENGADRAEMNAKLPRREKMFDVRLVCRKE